MKEDQGRKAEVLDRLSKSAIERFKTRLDWEWKARFGLWTALGLATAFTLGTDTWKPSASNVYVIGIGTAMLLAVYGIFFAISVHKLHHEDILIWLKCEEEIAKMIWGEVFTPPEIKRARHKSYWPCLLSIGQFLVTSLFGVALVYAVHTKANQVKLDKDHRSTLTIQQKAPYKMIIEPRSE